MSLFQNYNWITQKDRYKAMIESAPNHRDGGAKGRGIREHCRWWHEVGSQSPGSVVSDRNKVFFKFSLQAGLGREEACQIACFDLAGLVLDIFECYLSGRKVETDAGGGSHRVLTVCHVSFAPFAWRPGVTCPRQIAGAEYLEAMVRPGKVCPRVGSGATGAFAY